jgi:hypothetical protein
MAAHVMKAQWRNLNWDDQSTFRAAFAFLKGRLDERPTVEWALQLEPGQIIERLALCELLDGPGNEPLREPWATAWSMIREGWTREVPDEHYSTASYDFQRRLQDRDRSGDIISLIATHVAPRLKVEPISDWKLRLAKTPRRPKTYEHLLFTSLISGDHIDLSVVKLSEILEPEFLGALANALDAAANFGLDIARRFGWQDSPQMWQLGELRRVYYVEPGVLGGHEKDPDVYNIGISPSVKLLHAVVSRMAELKPESAVPFVRRWLTHASPVHIRLWAAMAKYPTVVSAADVANFLHDIDNKPFWDPGLYPEVAEVRARRFGEFSPDDQETIAARLRKGPPRDLWSRNVGREEVASRQRYWSLRELKRVEIAGGGLPAKVQSWLRSEIGQFPDLVNMTIEGGFPNGVEDHSVPPNPDNRYNTLEGVGRLRALEKALSSKRGSWHDDPEARARDWLQGTNNIGLVLDDLQTLDDGGNGFPNVWNNFGWAHNPREKQSEQENSADRNLQDEADRTLLLMEKLSDDALTAAIKGVCEWLDTWKEQVVASPLGLANWLRIWPLAVAATNTMQTGQTVPEISVLPPDPEAGEKSMTAESHGTPVGNLVSVFLVACQSNTIKPPPFAVGSAPRQMRDIAVQSRGFSGIIVRHRLIKWLEYFLRADPEWTRTHLIDPLHKSDEEARRLWQAVAYRTRFYSVLLEIGPTMPDRAADRRLSRRTRRSLASSLVVEALHALRDGREPAVPHSRVGQMLRSLDGEVRADAAKMIRRFVSDLSEKQTANLNVPSAADLFRSAALPFLQQVWPKERSLSAPGVASALADLPAASGSAFVEAVDAIERFLVPFDCWSMLDYGLYGDKDGRSKLAQIDTEDKAVAFLKMLDLTIGSSENSVIPNGLPSALDQIRSMSQKLESDPRFKRLATAARR